MEELFESRNADGTLVAFYNSVSPTPAGANAVTEILPQPAPLPPVNTNPDLTIGSGW